jgi:epoxyqueuosine reductase QueG
MAPKRTEMDLRSRLKEAVTRRGAAAFGVASVDAADALPRVKIGFTVNRWTEPIRKSMPEAASALVFGVASTDDADELELRRPDGSLAYPGYQPLKVIARDLATILRNEGWRAMYPSELVHHKSLAMLAGLGSYGKNSLIISPKHGPWLRFGVVVTDAPLEPDGSIEKDLCGKCTRCVRACPAGALKPYLVDPDKCLVGLGELESPPKSAKKLLAKYQPKLSPRAYLMCIECQMACPYTSAERRRMVFSAVRPRK